MAYFDIAIIALVALSALIGLGKGMFKTLISFFGWLVSAVVAIFLAKLVAEALLDVAAIRNFVLGTGESFSLYKWMYGMLPDSIKALENGTSVEVINGVLAADGNLLTKLVGGEGVVALLTGSSMLASTATVGEAMALIISNSIFTLLVGIGLFIAARIVMTLFTMFAKSMVQRGKPSIMSRFMGFVFGAVKGGAYVCIVILIMGFFMGVSFMNPVKNDLEASVIARPVSNVVYDLRDKYLMNDGDIFNKLLEYAGYKDIVTEEPEYEMTDNEKTLHDNILSVFNSSGHNYEFYIGTKFDPMLTHLKAYNDAAAAKIAAGHIAQLIESGEIAADTYNLQTIAHSFSTDDSEQATVINAAYQELMSNLDLFKRNLEGSVDNTETETLIMGAFTNIVTAYNELGMNVLLGEFGQYPSLTPPEADTEVQPEAISSLKFGLSF